ncbi:MAG TPA: hypothetical protein DD409_05215, partial [Bacteroidales bacterium]|nr:hypothetical protein [Bacteroidales bacterium]
MVFPDRSTGAKYAEVKAVYQPFRFKGLNLGMGQGTEVAVALTNHQH